MTKERLRNYQKLRREQEQIQQKLEEVEAALYFPRIQTLTGMPSHHGEGNPQEDLAIHHIELQEFYRSKAAEMAAEQLAVEKAIESLPPTERMLLRYRYLDGLKWEEICVRMNYSWTQTHAHHVEALRLLSEKSE